MILSRVGSIAIYGGVQVRVAARYRSVCSLLVQVLDASDGAGASPAGGIVIGGALALLSSRLGLVGEGVCSLRPRLCTLRFLPRAHHQHLLEG